jgi:inosine-uridine nucleoside N-ribohydrolase
MKKILIDTDLCCDCDDALALAIANICHNKGLITLLGVTHCLNDDRCAHFAKKINAYYHNDLPVGKSDCCVFDFQQTKKYFINELTDGDNVSTYPCSLDITLKQLYQNRDITLVYIGQLNNLAQLIGLSDEQYKGVKIGDLLRTHVREIVIMAGDFSDDSNRTIRAEFNVVKDLQAAIKVFSQADLPITVLDARQGGDVWTGASIKAQPHNPAGRAYQLFCEGICGADLRPSWDPLTVLYAVFGARDGFALSENGQIYVDETGITTFETGKGKHRLLKAENKAQLANRIEEITKN